MTGRHSESLISSTAAGVLRESTRRHFFEDCGVGLGKIALASLLTASPRVGSSVQAADGDAVPGDGDVSPPPARAKRVIFLFMAGAPSQLELFDPKPLLTKHDGEPVPAEVVRDQRYAFINRDAKLLAPRFAFGRHGQSGAELSETLPHLARVADKIAIVRSMTTDAFNHAPAQIFVNTGSQLLGRPSMGAWVSYGLGCESSDLPAFVVLTSGGGTSGGMSNWGAGFLPTSYQGVRLRSQGAPILDVESPAGVDRKLQRDSLDLIADLNREHLGVIGDPEIRTRIAAYEMAYRMQTSAPELIDIASESPRTLERYGAEPGKSSYANNCLLARRLVERGVRFVNVYAKGWDHHSNVEGGVRGMCQQTDRASAALVEDLGERGLLEDTLVVWGGEFGRTPMVESNAALGRKLGRDHHPQAFTMWFAGAGIRTGQTFGSTDDIGFHITEGRSHVHDLQATILHLLGIDHRALTYKHQGRQFRLTDVHGELMDRLLA